MNGGGFQKITRSGKAKRASRMRTGGGIKALITIGDLQSVVAAAKKWQAKCVEDGVDASKLLHHIANAEAVLTKYRTRNRLAFEERRRQEREEAEEAEGTGEPLPPPPPVTPREEPRFGSAVWNALNALGFGNKPKGAQAGEGGAKGERGSARPTRW